MFIRFLYRPNSCGKVGVAIGCLSFGLLKRHVLRGHLDLCDNVISWSLDEYQPINCTEKASKFETQPFRSTNYLCQYHDYLVHGHVLFPALEFPKQLLQAAGYVLPLNFSFQRSWVLWPVRECVHKNLIEIILINVLLRRCLERDQRINEATEI